MTQFYVPSDNTLLLHLYNQSYTRLPLPLTYLGSGYGFGFMCRRFMPRALDTGVLEVTNYNYNYTVLIKSASRPLGCLSVPEHMRFKQMFVKYRTHEQASDSMASLVILALLTSYILSSVNIFCKDIIRPVIGRRSFTKLYCNVF